MELKCDRYAFNIVTVDIQQVLVTQITCETSVLPFRALLEFSFSVSIISVSGYLRSMWEISGTTGPPVGVIDASFGQLKWAGPLIHTGTHTYTRALSLRTVQIIDSHEKLTLLPLTVATFIQAPSDSLLLSLDLQLVTALGKQRIHCCCRTISWL